MAFVCTSACHLRGGRTAACRDRCVSIFSLSFSGHKRQGHGVWGCEVCFFDGTYFRISKDCYCTVCRFLDRGSSFSHTGFMGQKKAKRINSSFWPILGFWNSGKSVLGRFFTKDGFTLVELVIVIAIVGILSVGVITALNPLEQIKKGRDAQRKNDLSQIQKALEVYYNDKVKYPDNKDVKFGESWQPYMAKVPQDPKSPQTYVYQNDAGGYRLFAKLERCPENQTIAGINCSTEQYNYSVTSPNLSVCKYNDPNCGAGGQTPAPTGSVSTPTPTPTVTSSPTPTPFAGLINGSFENQLASWDCVGAISGTCTQDTVTKFSGNASAKVVNTGGFWGWQLSQGNISALLGDQFCLSAMVKKQTATDKIIVAIQEIGPNTEWRVVSLSASDTTDWQLVRGTVTVNVFWFPPIQVFLRVVYANQAAWFDDVSLTRGACL